jgi:hypothetical protein
LVDLQVTPARAAEIKEQSRDWPSWDLSPRQLCDLELLANGGFSPLTGFLRKADYESVCAKMRLADGTLWTIPITLDVSSEFAEKIKPGAKVALRDAEGVMLAVISVEDIWKPDFEAEALHRRQGRGTATAIALRLPLAAILAGAAPRGVCQARLAKGCRFSNTQSHAPRSSRADASRCQGGRGQSARAPGRRHDEAR